MTQPGVDEVLNDCDREPIHIPGHIQPFGHLIVAEQANSIISHVSENIESLGLSSSKCLGIPLREVTGLDAFHKLANILAASTSPQLPGRLFDLLLPRLGRFNCTAHIHEGGIYLELEPNFEAYDAAAPLTILRIMLARMQNARTVHEACSIVVEQMRTLIDFDRVMIYRFLEDGSGCVIAESCAAAAASFLGHRYPATDIPRQARLLYLKNWIRQISDVRASQVPVLAAAGTDSRPLDMTFCSLRSVSPVHIEYLRNMGVAASLSVSIVVGGQLWGLIACHNGEARVVPPDVRIAAELFGQAFSLQIQTLSRADAAVALRDARRGIDNLVAELKPGAHILQCLGPRLGDIAQLLSCHGASLLIDQSVLQWGCTPGEAETRGIVDWLGEGRHEMFVTHELSSHYPSAASFAENASGIMALPLSRDAPNYLLLFRRELVQTVNWAGNPYKPPAGIPDANRLTPRKSFAIWQETVRRQSQPWEPHDRLTAEALRIALIEVVLKCSELLAQERAKSENQQRVHAAELNHRIKNSLALISALATNSSGKDRRIDEFVTELKGRIQSLAHANDLGVEAGIIELRRLFQTELAPFTSLSHTIEIAGPDVWLSGHASSTVALVVHEMTTNAAKYGALSGSAGHIVVRWQCDDSGACAIEWVERGGPRVSRAPPEGFGSFLIRNQIPFELNGRSEIRFAPAGVEIMLRLPADCILTSPQSAERRRLGGMSTRALARIFDGTRVLVVEDSLILAREIERELRGHGVRDVVLCGNIETALEAQQTEEITAAVLDINLRGLNSYAVADALADRGIPFIFVTGYGLGVVIPERFRDARIVAKPASASDLVAALAGAIKRAGGRRAVRRRPGTNRAESLQIEPG